MSEARTFRMLAWEWDVDQLEQLVDRATATTLPVGEWADPFLDSDPHLLNGADGARRRIGFIYTDWDQVDQLPPASLTSPVFVVTLPTDPKSLLLVDGWHRLALARRRNLAHLPAHVFDQTTSALALTPRSHPYRALASSPLPASRTQAAS